MCGIFGIISKPQRLPPPQLKKIIDRLFILSQSRGKEASGFALLADNQALIYKQPVTSSKLIKSPEYLELFTKDQKLSSLSSTDCFVFLGHSRLATNGLQTENRNNQPLVKNRIIAIHNGIIVNHRKIYKKFLKKKKKYQIDTEILLDLIAHFYNLNPSFTHAIQKTFALLEGSASTAFLKDNENFLALATNTGSLYYTFISSGNLFIFASEANILKNIINKFFQHSPKTSLNHLPAGQGALINLSNLRFQKFSLCSSSPAKLIKKILPQPQFTITELSNLKSKEKTVYLHKFSNKLSVLKKHRPDYRAISQIKRCSRCILPDTTPFIKFDQDNVCNYCNNHRPLQYQGVTALKKLVKPFRSKNGKPDCILAFSGGRDSSYGLHFLKRKLGLNPIVFTYDWGMVTDLARRNQARLVGKLGVEHILVSADISQKRKHIRQNILAWLKRPVLGMVPLFMEGDKQCEYYIDRLKRQTGIKLVFFCRGNQLENEEFKAGHCGVKNADPQGVIHDLAWTGKLQILSYYAKQYFLNPSYINSSIFDTSLAYFFTYLQKHDYIFLWHYIPWNEKQIIKTITKEYGWETAEDSTLTWRTDDGSPAFYNYIYYTVQGFTENDSFRSRQVREGILTRKEALKLVQFENKPRYQALKWYFDKVGLNGHQVLTVVDNIPKLY